MTRGVTYKYRKQRLGLQVAHSSSVDGCFPDSEAAAVGRRRNVARIHTVEHARVALGVLQHASRGFRRSGDFRSSLQRAKRRVRSYVRKITFHLV